MGGFRFNDNNKRSITMKKIINPAVLANIKATVDGSEVKDLRWLSVDNIIVGLVKDKIYGKPHINKGYLSGQWRFDGTPVNRIKGRDELKLKILE